MSAVVETIECLCGPLERLNYGTHMVVNRNVHPQCPFHGISPTPRDVTVLDLEPARKPPIGLVPRNIHASRRLREVQEAITRYIEADWAVPEAWFEELNDLTEQQG